MLEARVAISLAAWFAGWLFVATNDWIRDLLPLIAWLILMGLTLIPVERAYRRLRAEKYETQSPDNSG